MGSGHSRLGSQKHKHPEHAPYPYGMPQPQPFFPPGYQPSPYAVPATMYHHQPQGVVPPGVVYPQPHYMPPPPQIDWLTPHGQKKSRKSRRRNSDRERFAGGFASEAPSRRESHSAQAASQRRRSESQARRNTSGPVMPEPEPYQARAPSRSPNPGRSIRRTSTPFIPALPDPLNDDEDEEDDDDDDDYNDSPPRRPPPRSRSPIRADMGHVVEVLQQTRQPRLDPPVNASGYAHNPLPAPPRDLYAMSPYKQLLNLPQTTALLTATYGPQQATIRNGAVVNTSGIPSAAQQQPAIERKKTMKSLFRAFSRKEKPKEPEPPKVHFIPVFVPGSGRPQDAAPTTSNPVQTNVDPLSRRPSTLSQPLPSVQRVRTPEPPSQPQYASSIHSRRPSMQMPVPSTQQSGTSMSHSRSASAGEHLVMPPIPPSPRVRPALHFDQDHPRYAVFMNHSPHPIVYNQRRYPSALHLSEALKFYPVKPEISEMIRTCGPVDEVYPLSARYSEYIRGDWNENFMDIMEDVVYLKFMQHADLLSLLLSTQGALIYDDESDSFWGSGPDGTGNNELGKLLERVRDRHAAGNMAGTRYI
ncbi:hypothetical protein CVT24_003022 [Panaeolus cyanescens]|uniref:NADAR domain-containing protein n=1 Tax=Panaeolus cyanescens TaxID=181874 RepID=A0A409W8T5_9AGAR|nr:hypothetical protein CVT24_003022 [Panaeolus cyanescens]